MKRNPYLRVKLKSLAAEAKIIRGEERRANGFRDFSLQNSLREHRTSTVRDASRYTLLAYQYLRGIPYAAVEKEGSKWIDWKPVLQMVHKYGYNRRITVDDLRRWKDGKPSAFLKAA